MATDRSPVVEARGLSKRFGDVEALVGLDVEAQSGGVTAGAIIAAFDKENVRTMAAVRAHAEAHPDDAVDAACTLPPP